MNSLKEFLEIVLKRHDKTATLLAMNTSEDNYLDRSFLTNYQSDDAFDLGCDAGEFWLAELLYQRYFVHLKE